MNYGYARTGDLLDEPRKEIENEKITKKRSGTALGVE